MPGWAEELRRRYVRGEASVFVLHGNVFDTVVHQQKLVGLTEFLTDTLLKDTKDTIVVYNVATGVRFAKRAASVDGVSDLVLASDKTRALTALERLLITSTKVAAVFEYAETIAPVGD